MITLYHGRNPYLPLLAAYTHLAVNDSTAKIHNGLSLDWRLKPLFVAGKDKDDTTIACLIHGKHQGMYCRAVTGIASVFGFEVRCQDADEIFSRILPRSLNSKLLILLASHTPMLMRSCDLHRLRQGFANYLKIQEEQR